jgi:hypothetical protein
MWTHLEIAGPLQWPGSDPQTPACPCRGTDAASGPDPTCVWNLQKTLYHQPKF